MCSTLQAVEWPTEEKNNTTCEFKKHFKKLPVYLAVYADFECLLVPSDNGGTKHIPCGYAAIRVATDPGRNGELECYSEPGSPEDIVDHFLEYLEKQDKFAQEILSVNQPMNLTDEEEQTFQDASHCYVCGGHFVGDKLKKFGTMII